MKKRGLLIFIAAVVYTALSVLAMLASSALGVGMVLGLIIVLTVFFRNFYGLILYILMMYIMPHYYVETLQHIHIMLLLAITILLIFFIHKIFRRERIDMISSRHTLLIFILLILVYFSNISNLYFAAAWAGFREFLTVFFLFFFIVSLIETFEEFRMTCTIIIICTVLIAINGLIMAFRGYGLMGNIPIEGRIVWTKGSHFGDPNDFALAIISFFPFILVNLFEKDFSRIKRILLFVIAAIMLTAIYYTNSRGGFIGLSTIMAFFAFKKWGLLRGIIVTSVVLVAVIIFGPSRMGDLSPYEGSASGRIDAWITGLTMLKSRPIFGVGYNNFTEIHGRTAHSAFILCMAELGLVGYFVWLALIFSSYTGLKRVEERGSRIQAKYAGIIRLSLIGFLVSAFFLSQAYAPILFILLALSAALIKLARPAVTLPRGLSARDIAWIITVIVISVAAFKLLSLVYF